MSNKFPRKELVIVKKALKKANADNLNECRIPIGDNQVFKDLKEFVKYNNFNWLGDKYPVAMMLYEELVLEMNIYISLDAKKKELVLDWGVYWLDAL